MAILSTKGRNYNYAPGITTYGVDGAKGDAGKNGNSIFFSNYDFVNNHNDLIEIVEKIRSRKSLKKNDDTVFSRDYIDGDIILTADAKLYKITNYSDYELNYNIVSSNMNSLDYFLFFTSLGEISVVNKDSSFFDVQSNSNKISSSNKLVLKNTSSSNSNTDAYDSILNVVSDNQNDQDNLLTLMNISQDGEYHKLNVYFDSASESFVFSSDDKIVFDSPLVQVDSESSSQETFDNYSTLIAKEKYSDSITGFYNMCSNATWSFNSSKLEISIADNLKEVFPIDNTSILVYYKSGSKVEKYLYDFPKLADNKAIVFLDSAEEPYSVSILHKIEVTIKKA